MKRIFNIICLLFSFWAFSQNTYRVGISTEQPKATLHIAEVQDLVIPETQSQGVIFPHFSTERRAKFNNIEVGMLIWNTTKKCVEMYLGYYNNQHNWTCIRGNSTIQNDHQLRIFPAGFTGYYVDNFAFDSYNTVRWRITNNGTEAISNVDFSNAVTLTNGTAQITTLPNQNTDISIPVGGSVILSYTLSGIPQQGELKAVFNHIGLYSKQIRNVDKEFVVTGEYTRSEKFFSGYCFTPYYPNNYTFSKTYTGTGTGPTREIAEANALEEAKKIAYADANFRIEGQKEADEKGTCFYNPPNDDQNGNSKTGTCEMVVSGSSVVGIVKRRKTYYNDCSRECNNYQYITNGNSRCHSFKWSPDEDE